MKAIVVLGPTASGKTKLAANLAHRLGGEVLSIDSRQVYRGMDIGTGKDLEDLVVEGQRIPIHLVDIADPGQRLSMYDFLRHFDKHLALLREKSKVAVLCGGTGMYLDAILRGYHVPEVVADPELHAELDKLSTEELVDRLRGLGPTHNTTDTEDRNRLIRAIEIGMFKELHPEAGRREALEATILGMRLSRPVLRERITHRLDHRLQNGLIEEAETLIRSGVSPADLDYYGLEYRYLSRYLAGDISQDMMRDQLNTAIHQFAKRQETWFRRMEKNGVPIHWIDASQDLIGQLADSLRLIGKESFV